LLTLESLLESRFTPDEDHYGCDEEEQQKAGKKASEDMNLKE
jgi:hypothetical protein